MSTIFIPLTVLAGIHGMNFAAMPKLYMRWAYPAVLAVMALVGVGMSCFFWRKGVIGAQGEELE